ncbi:MAG: hypothetical protein ACI9DF_003922 [Verrucomicrobiales bacterium]
MILEFDRPVHDLVLPLHGINGFLKAAKRFNSGDELEIAAFLGAEPSESPNYDAMWPAMKKVGNKLVGDFSRQIDDGISGQRMSNDGSCKAVFPPAVDHVVLTLINRAGHPNPGQFQDGQQTWSMGLGDMTFTHESTALTNLARQSGVTVSQSSTFHPHTQAEHLIDGNSNGNLWDGNVSHTGFEVQSWVSIDLGAIRSIDQLVLWQRTDTLAGGPLSDLVVFLSNEPFDEDDPALTESQLGVTTRHDLSATNGTIVLNGTGRYVCIQRLGVGALSVAEVELLGAPSPATEAFLPATPTEPRHAANDPSPNPLLYQLGYFALISDENIQAGSILRRR